MDFPKTILIVRLKLHDSLLFAKINLLVMLHRFNVVREGKNPPHPPPDPLLHILHSFHV